MQIWKATVLRGAVAIAFSVVILVWPKIGLTTLIALLGAFALVSGLATIAGAFSVPMPGNRRAFGMALVQPADQRPLVAAAQAEGLLSIAFGPT